MNLSTPDFHTTRCIRYRYRYSECRRCADACPRDAICLSDEGAAVDPAKCHNCALCTTACRTGALSASNLPRVDILKRALGRPQVSFACAPSGEQADERVPCLGAIDAAMLAYLGKRGIQVMLRGAAHCADCALGSTGRESLAEDLEGRDELCASMPGEQWASVQVPEVALAKTRREDFMPGRRQLFRRLVGQGVDQAMGASAPEQIAVEAKAIRAGSWYVPEMRELVRIVRRGEPQSLSAHASLPLAYIRLEAGCTACEACFRACPTGAIQIREDDESWRLSFSPERCVGCGVCVDVCQTRALAQADPVPRDAPETLWHRLAKQRCGRCDRFFVSASPENICAVCTDDDEAFGAIFGTG